MDFNRYSLNTYFLLMRRHQLRNDEIFTLFFFFFVIFKLLNYIYQGEHLEVVLLVCGNEQMSYFLNMWNFCMTNCKTFTQHINIWNTFIIKNILYLPNWGCTQCLLKLFCDGQEFIFLKAQLYNESKENGNFH